MFNLTPTEFRGLMIVIVFATTGIACFASAVYIILGNTRMNRNLKKAAEMLHDKQSQSRLGWIPAIPTYRKGHPFFVHYVDHDPTTGVYPAHYLSYYLDILAEARSPKFTGAQPLRGILQHQPTSAIRRTLYEILKKEINEYTILVHNQSLWL